MEITTKKYDGKIEKYSKFQKQVQTWAKGCTRLGYVIASYHTIIDGEYFEEIQVNGAHNYWIDNFLQSNGLETFNSWHDRSDEKLKRNESLCNVSKIFNALRSSDTELEMVGDLIYGSCFQNIGILLFGDYDYYNLSANTLEEWDEDIFDLLNDDPRFSIQFTHVLRVHSMRDYWDQHKEIADKVVRFHLDEYNAKMNGSEMPNKEKGAEIPFFQLSKGAVLHECWNESDRYSGNTFSAALAECISFCSAMIVTKVDVAMPCDQT